MNLNYLSDPNYFIKLFRMRYSFPLAAAFWLVAALQILHAQQKITLDYYLPAGTYNTAIPTPESYLGFQVGERHASHDQQLGYMRALDAASDRIQLREYGRTHENRPLVCLTITAPENFVRLDDIRQSRQALMDPARNGSVDLKNLPAVAYMGYSIHGNETSGANAAFLVAYYLAAAQNPDVETFLKNTVVLLDPCFNPDGMQRFSSWVNSRRSKSQVADPSSDEYNEPWPRGRTNHYWFDLNRDWLVAQQPESRGRVDILQEWKPNVLTDHHEMGSSSTFFFQPGVPSRVNPITPARNQELTAKIARYHNEILSQKRIFFYTEENFDDFYYGKGSTYPDANGCVGILFEQASSRGSVQETDNGLLTFPFTVRNQVLTSLSTIKAVGEMRLELNQYLRDFYKTAPEEARKDPVKGYLFSWDNRDLPGLEFLNILLRHNIEVRNVQENVVIDGKTFAAGNAFWVPTEQAQYRLIRGIFERQTTFQDSIFYDISAWTLPDAFGLTWAPVPAKEVNSRWISDQKGVAMTSRYAVSMVHRPALAYVVGAVGYELPRVLAQLHRDHILVKVATKPFTADNQRFEAGSILIPGEGQPLGALPLLEYINNKINNQLPVYPLYDGLTPEGPDLGSSSFAVLRAPSVALITGEGVRPEDAGEIWHLLDLRYGLSVVHLDQARLGSTNLSKYNTLIVADASLNTVAADKIKEFVTGGGTLIATGNALTWLKNAGLLAIEMRSQATDTGGARRPYGGLSEDRGARTLPGAIFEAELDLTHPLCYGYTRPKIPLFLGDTLFMEKTKNVYATPVIFTENPLLAGYVHHKQKPLLSKSAAVVVGGLGRGRVIGFAGNPNFRGFWYGTNRLFANAVFFGNLISGEAVEKK